jgi:hypothetical protein
MKKITFVKILLIVVFIGTMIFFTRKWNVSLEPPRQIKEVSKTEKLPTQMVIDVVMPAYARAKQNDSDLHQRDPEAYADRFNRNNELYNRSVSFAYENGVSIGDTVQLKYFHQYDPPEETYWDLVSTKPPFYESVENQQYTYVEYTKGIVREVK